MPLTLASVSPPRSPTFLLPWPPCASGSSRVTSPGQPVKRPERSFRISRRTASPCRSNRAAMLALSTGDHAAKWIHVVLAGAPDRRSSGVRDRLATGRIRRWVRLYPGKRQHESRSYRSGTQLYPSVGTRPQALLHHSPNSLPAPRAPARSNR